MIYGLLVYRQREARVTLHEMSKIAAAKLVRIMSFGFNHHRLFI